MKLNLGELPENTEQLGQRDAFHAPCILVVANEDIEPGENVKFINAETVVTCSKNQRQAVADPFIEETIIESQPFWVMLVPNSITQLSHHFKVKGIDDDDPVNDNRTGLAQLYSQPSRDEGYVIDDDDDDGCRGCY